MKTLEMLYYKILDFTLKTIKNNTQLCENNI